MISREFPPGPQVGGVGRATFNLAHALGEQNHDVVVVTQDLGLGVAAGSFVVRTWSDRDVSRALYLRYRVGRRWEFAYRVVQSEAAFAVAQAEADRGGRFDVIDTWLWGAEATRYPRHRGLGPLLVRLSSPDFEIREQHGFEARPDLDALDQHCLTTADTVAAISQQNLELIATRFKINRDKVIMTPLGVPVAPEDEPPASSTRAPKEILFVGRLEGRKGVEDLLAALEIVLDLHPDANLTLAGSATGTNDAGESFASHIDTRITTATKTRIKLIGRLNDNELRLAYRRATVAVFPSRYESFGLVVLEAMLHGTPVIATTAGGIPEVAGDAALLVPPRSPYALAEAIVKLFDDPKLRSSLGNAGAARVRARFTTEQMLSSTLAAYEHAHETTMIAQPAGASATVRSS